MASGRSSSGTTRIHRGVAVPSLYLRSAFALPSLKVRFHKRPRSNPKKALQRGWIRPALQLQCYSSIYPKSVIRVGHALRNSYSVTVPFPHCTTQPQSGFSNCSNRSVAPAISSAPPACSSAGNPMFFLLCRRIVVLLQIKKVKI